MYYATLYGENPVIISGTSPNLQSVLLLIFHNLLLFIIIIIIIIIHLFIYVYL